MESVKISPKKCYGVSAPPYCCAKAEAMGSNPAELSKFFRVDLQLLKLQLRLRRSHLSGGSRPSDKGGGGVGPRAPKIFFSVLRTSVWSRSATASSFKSFTCVSLRNYLVTFLPPRTTSHVPPYETASSI